MLWNYTSNYLEIKVLYRHMYFLTTMLPSAFTMVASALPVGFMLVYQYCTNHGKNYYIYITVLSAIFAFVLAPIESWLGLTHMADRFHYGYLFVIDLAIAFSTFWFVKWLKSVRK
ncbi:type IV secretory pathway TrbL component [Alkalibacillus flavidus]|uniref:Type IV secretory pathway TrbL component n=1 Tax=Alkalibacillus flavidus TaxID=546021 RepID=A0ABV2KTU1_9BACI